MFVGFTGCAIVPLPTPAMPEVSEKDHWRQAQAEDTRDAYQRFLADHPTSPLAANAALKIQNMDATVAFRELEGSHVPSEAYESFLRKYPLSEHSVRAYLAMRERWTQEPIEAENFALAAAISQGTAKALEDFIAQHPNSSKLNEARKALEPLVPNTGYLSTLQSFNEYIKKQERASKDPQPAKSRFRLVFFHARTTESASHIIYKQRDYNYYKVIHYYDEDSWRERSERLPSTYELLELRGIEPMSTLVLYISDSALSNNTLLEWSVSKLIGKFWEAHCLSRTSDFPELAVGTTPSVSSAPRSDCLHEEMYLIPDGTLPEITSGKAKGASFDTLREATKRRPAFGTHPIYLQPVQPPPRRWEDSLLHVPYIDELCQKLGSDVPTKECPRLDRLQSSPRDRDRFTTNALALQVIGAHDRRSRTLILAVKLGIPGSHDKLGALLMVYGDRSMAEDYLNSGSDELHDWAVKWGKAHGYSIHTGPGSNRAAWGRF